MSPWERRLAILGAVAGGVLAAKVFRVLYLWAELALGPVRVRRFKGDWALITGGSEGVGKAVATALAKEGINVVLVSRSQIKLDAAAKEIKQRYPAIEVRTVAADLSAQESCQQVLTDMSTSNIPISILVTSVGATKTGCKPYWEFSDEEEQYMLAVNGQSYYTFIKGLLPGMVQRRKGAVVAVSSFAHKLPAYVVPYGAEKAKINALMTALDIELHGTGVTAQAMVLGRVITPAMAQEWLPPGSNGSSSGGLGTPPTTSGSSSSRSNTAAAAVAADPVAAAEAAMAQIKAGVTLPRADAVGAAMVLRIGWGGPVVTPWWGHVLAEQFMDSLWPPALQRTFMRRASRNMKDVLDERLAAKTAKQ